MGIDEFAKALGVEADKLVGVLNEEGEIANESGATLNPALLTIGEGGAE